MATAAKGPIKEVEKIIPPKPPTPQPVRAPFTWDWKVLAFLAVVGYLVIKSARS